MVPHLRLVQEKTIKPTNFTFSYKIAREWHMVDGCFSTHAFCHSEEYDFVGISVSVSKKRQNCIGPFNAMVQIWVLSYINDGFWKARHLINLNFEFLYLKCQIVKLKT